jgi:Zn finger protein HypA/HybF involved in hydrogenase expression
MKNQEIKFLCHKCGKEVSIEGKPLNCPHCDHSIGWGRVRVGFEDKFLTIYEVTV